jgi:predicted nucleic acid-binding protein
VIVVDASVVAAMLVYADERGQKARAVMARDIEWAAPETGKSKSSRFYAGWSSAARFPRRTARAVERLPWLGVDHVPLDSLLPRMWQLRAAISGYDAAYVALAEAVASRWSPQTPGSRAPPRITVA